MDQSKNTKSSALLYCLFVYITAATICFLVHTYLPGDNLILHIAILDVIATIIVFIFSIIFNNSSIYDPFWSVAPVPILIFWALNTKIQDVNTTRQVIIISIVLVWAIRLTYNCFMRWEGLKHEDWRYSKFRNRSKIAYWTISFTGFNFMPTVVVFFACLAIYPALSEYSHSIGMIDIFAITITLSAIFIEAISDFQLRKYLKSNPPEGEFLQTGLWKYSRHPNYFGEVLFWIGLFLFSTSGAFYWWILLGPILMILLFYLISIPMIDRRMSEHRKNYDVYKKSTSGLILWFNNHK